MSSWWNEEFNAIIPIDFLKQNWQSLSDRAIADELSDLTSHPVSPNAVRHKRRKMGWINAPPLIDPIPAEPYQFTPTSTTLLHTYEICPTGTIKTLDQVLSEAKVDLTTWRVDRYLINKWPVGAKAEKKSLHWKDGRIESGFVESDGLTVAQLWQVKVWLVRIHLEPIFPTVQPIQVPYSFATPLVKAPPRHGLSRTLVWSDPQFGYLKQPNGDLIPLHNELVLDLILQIWEVCGADRMDILGDLLDFAEVSRYRQLPEYKDLLQPAVNRAFYWLSLYRNAHPTASIFAYEGNHDARLNIFTLDNLRSAYELKPANELHLPPSLSVPRLLALHDLGITWIDGYPKAEQWLNDELKLHHGNVARAPGLSAKQIISNSDVNEICGHTHRSEVTIKTIHRRGIPRTVRGITVGCTCHRDGRVPSADTDEQWSNDFLIVDYDPNGTHFSYQVITVEDNQAIYDGKLYTGRKHSVV